MREIRNVIQGAFFGAAVGDALGAPVETMKPEEIKEIYGVLTEMVGGGWLDLKPGECTDDTSMILDVAKGILINHAYPIEEIGYYFLRWFQSQPKDIGKTTKTSFQNYMRTGSWQEASRLTAQTLNKLDSNGGLMRTLPVTFGYWNNLQSMVKWSTQIANMTHYSVESTVSCIFYNLLLYNLQTLTGDKRSMISSTLTLTDKHCQVMGLHPGQFFWQIIKAIQKNAEPIVPRENVLDTLATTLQCFLSTDNFEDALIKAVNKGYDSDTVGNILGGLAGSYYGYQAIPERWLAPLTVKEELMDVVNGFLQLWQQKGFTLN